ncbi:hypothetical protein [Streptomyces sp. SYSU K21746]
MLLVRTDREHGHTRRLFLNFYPLYTGQPIPMDSWRNRMWFDTWV